MTRTVAEWVAALVAVGCPLDEAQRLARRIVRGDRRALISAAAWARIAACR